MNRMIRLFAIASFLSPAVTANAAPPGLVSSEFIFEAAPFPSCHASTIVESHGNLVAAWFGGKAWSAPRRLPEQIDGPVKNKPVQLASGDILCPCSTESSGWRVHFERTSDLGRTWERTDEVNARAISAIQPSILFLGGDKLL